MVPRIYIHRTGSAIEIDLITGSSCHDHQGLFNEVMRVMNEEGAEVVSASFSAVGSNVFHTIRSEMRQHDNAGLEEGDSSLMLTTARISHRLERIGCVDYAY
ncbi:hypothetical protein SAY86_011548 [Trapa natans]|uniref:Uncharacterized protein n=1 Tax=Trapa natans TaxID=22666 RepID=A0AAN7R4C1_TRANT|nr:hypothetical protein SAY86_011548 [Trapa natans]